MPWPRPSLVAERWKSHQGDFQNGTRYLAGQALTARAARGHPHRHVLTRALGVRRAVEPDLAELTPAVNDTFVLCSDGLTGHVEDDEIAEMILAEADLESACERLIDAANARGGEDNTTIVLVRCDKE